MHACIICRRSCWSCFQGVQGGGAPLAGGLGGSAPQSAAAGAAGACMHACMHACIHSMHAYMHACMSTYIAWTENHHKIGQIASDRRETLWKRRAEREESKNRGPEAQKPQTIRNFVKKNLIFFIMHACMHACMHSMHA